MSSQQNKSYEILLSSNEDIETEQQQQQRLEQQQQQQAQQLQQLQQQQLQQQLEALQQRLRQIQTNQNLTPQPKCSICTTSIPNIESDASNIYCEECLRKIDSIPSGFPFKMVTEVSEYVCPICLSLIENATELTCSHLMCKRCLEYYEECELKKNEKYFYFRTLLTMFLNRHEFQSLSIIAYILFFQYYLFLTIKTTLYNTLSIIT